MTGRPPDGDSHDPLSPIVESFLARFRRGERPAVSEYLARYPGQASELRDLIPALVEMEAAKTGDHAAAARPAPAAGAPPRLDRLGDYRVFHVIGRGGMGIVYEAEHASLESRVALKVMHPRFSADEAYQRRFLIEARSGARLHHTNIVPVFDYGRERGTFYYAMQFIPGQGLDRVLADVRRLRQGAEPAAPGGEAEGPDGPHLRTISEGLLTGRFATGPTADLGLARATTRPVGPVPPGGATLTAPPEGPAAPRPDPGGEGFRPDPPAGGEVTDSSGHSLTGRPEARYFREVARIGAQVADALHYAHSRGVLHRDVKPSNLLLDTRGVVWVTDFGLAKLDGERVSQAGDILGTLHYMSPERFLGESGPGSDVYALGATLYEMLTLRPVFDAADRYELLDRIKNHEPVPPRRIDPRVPPDLEAIVLKCLAKAPGDRFATAAELRDELERVVQNRPTRTRPLSRPERLWRWARRNPGVAGLGTLAAALTVAVAAVASAAAYRNGRLATDLEAGNAEAHRNLVQAWKNLIQSYTTEAEARRQSRRVGQRFETLAAVGRAAELAPKVGLTAAQRDRLRDEAIAALALPDLRVARTLDVTGGRDRGCALDPANARYAFKRGDGTVVVRRLADDAELFRAPGLPPDEADAPAGFSPDGRYLVMKPNGHGPLEVWDVQERRPVLTDPQAATSIVANWGFRPDGRELAVGRHDRSIVFYDLPSGRPVGRWPGPDFVPWTVAYSPDGTRIAVQTGDGSGVQVFSRADGRTLATLRVPAGAEHLAWNPRRPNLLAVAGGDGVAYVWEVDAGRQTVSLRGQTGNGLVLAFHPNGELLASCGWNNRLVLWDTRTGRAVLTRPWNRSLCFEFDRTGRYLGVDAAADRVDVFEFAEGAECRTLVREPFREDDRHGALALDPTGRRAVTAGTALTLWDLPGGATLATLPLTGQQQPRFDPAGAVLTPSPSVFRWALTETPGGETQIGPPRLLRRRGSAEAFKVTPDGRTSAVSLYHQGAVLFDPANPQDIRTLRPQADVRYVAVSPDSRWAVTGSHSKSEMRLWDARTGRPVRELPGPAGGPYAPWSFSPDGRWLAVWSEGWFLYDTATWAPRVLLFRGPTTRYGLAFSPDSRTVVYGDNAGVAVLADVASGRELARFEDPDQGVLNWAAFTPDGARLVITLLDRPYLRVWDLRAVRRRLARLGLGWGPPGGPDAPEAADPYPAYPKPLRVDRGPLVACLTNGAETPEETLTRTGGVLAARPDDPQARHELGHALARLKRYDEAVAAFTAALNGRPDDPHLLASRALAEGGRGRLDAQDSDAEVAARALPGSTGEAAVDPVRDRLALACNGRAWELAAGPAARRDAPRAVRLARVAVALNPDQPLYLNTLGVALYRAADHAGAVPVLEASLAAGAGASDPFDLYFLAMARHRLNQPDAARADLDRAARWVADRPRLDARWLAEMKAFQAEAEAVLAGPPGELPRDVFAPAGP